jgi:glycosyltransferase involved in cell wall biosynthesis
MSTPLVTVLINNHNYGRFLGRAIESALAQSYPRVEVVVVDDGSDDSSRDVIAGFAGDVVAVYKENGGQASAFNAGFRRAQGAIVSFLDADDALGEHLVERVVDAFGRHHDAGMVQCRVELVDERDNPLGLFVPPSYIHMPTADLRGSPADLNNASWWAPTSGISVKSEVLTQILPLPEATFRLSADIALTRACALVAPVVSLERPAGYYRSHGGNRYNREGIDLERLRADALRYAGWHAYLREFATTVGIEGYPADAYSIRDTVFRIERLLLVRFAPEKWRVPGDTRVRVALQGARDAWRRPDIGVLLKGFLAVWFLLVAALPRRLARRLAERTLFQPNLRRLRRSAFRRSA